MAFFNQSLAQIRDLFASMTPAARITAGLLLGVIVVSLGYLFQGYAGASEEYLFEGEMLGPRETGHIEAAIAQANLELLPRRAGRIVVPRGQKSAYLAAIADAGALPKNFDALLEESFDTGMFESGETRKARLKAALERQLSMMISEMQGVEDAKVLYASREPVGFEKPKTTATVSLRPAPGSTLEAHRVEMIREAVAGAISGLDSSSVTILNLSTGSEFAGGNPSDGILGRDPYHRIKLAYERNLKAEIENLLQPFIKPTARVQVSAELDPLAVAETETIRPDGDPATIRETKDMQTTSNTRLEDRGRPGIIANGPAGPAAEQAVAKNEEKTESETVDTTNFVPHTRENRREHGLTPELVRASIAIPSEYLVRVWRERTPDAAADAKPDQTMLDQIEEQTRTNIKSMVSQLLPKGVAENAQSYVDVTVFQSLTPDPVPEPSLASTGLLWASNNSGSLIMAGLAIVSLAMLRSMVKSIPAADASLAFKAPAIAPDTITDDGPAAASSKAEPSSREGGRPRLRLKKGPTLKDDLAELVKEDPDGAAAILRTWIGTAG